MAWAVCSNEKFNANPRAECDQEQSKLRMFCQFCGDGIPETVQDVAYWNDMPAEMIEQDAVKLAVEAFFLAVDHMKLKHGMVPG